MHVFQSQSQAIRKNAAKKSYLIGKTTCDSDVCHVHNNMSDMIQFKQRYTVTVTR